MTDQNANSAVFRGTITPRYTDLDTWRHVNNSRVYQLHLEARIQALVARFGANAWFSDSERLRPLRTITQYREMSFYGSGIAFSVEVLGCDAQSVRLRSQLYQNGQLVGIQDCVLGAFLNHEQVPLPAQVYNSFRTDAPAMAEPLPEAAYLELAKDFSRFPISRELTPRYADMDADSQRSEAAIVRYMEQARFGFLRTIDFGKRGLLIAALDISFSHYRPSSNPVELVIGASRAGNTSFQLTGGATTVHGVHAVANSVMVVVDLETGRPTPITADIKDQLGRLQL
ncbi:thioesterase family protein [Stutzerimonas stutzeri]|uniref:thioesterase family protein n=1 Tax=Stutzerimonas stutzeri TaxID=316 RepID=UPI00210CFE6D|nr:thioesterase family protein [Stutzerimonas stutzeri]MCQ4322471.1 hypothetical protein [Stutzerimonas stutzeri]